MLLYRHDDQLSELGDFSCISIGDLIQAQGRICTPWCIGTTVPGQERAERFLRAFGWTDLGHRYNQLHGPNFITLWAKRFKPRMAPHDYCDKHFFLSRHNAPPNSAYCCGLWVALEPDAKMADTKWLALMRSPEQPGADWHRIGTSDFWHTAEPHDIRNDYGAREREARWQRWEFRNPLQPTIEDLRTVRGE